MLRKFILALHYLWNHYYVPFHVKKKGVILGKDVVFIGMPVVSMAPSTSIQIGDGCLLCSTSNSTALGVNHPIVLRTLSPGASISIGSGSGISGGSICAVNSVSIGQDSLIGANVTIMDTDFHALLPAGRRHNKDNEQIGYGPVIIGNNVFLGTGVVVMKGVSIGDNSVIGAFSVVTRSISSGVVAAGNPARKLREF